MKITNVDGYCLSSPYGDGKVFGQPLGVKSIGIAEVKTDDGLVGIGETYSGVYVPELIEPTVKFIESLIVGMNPLNIEDVYNSMDIPFVGMNGFIRSVIGGIEMALWDIKGKVEEKPLYKLFNESSTNDFKVYNSGGSVSFSTDEIKKDIEDVTFDGYKMRVGVQSWGDDLNRVDVAKKELGSKKLMIDSIMGTLNTWDKYVAVDNINSLRHHDLTWFEEPLHPSNLKDLKYVWENCSPLVPIATGEGLSGKLDFDSYLDSGHVDVIQPDITYCGGFMMTKKIIEQAKSNGIKVALHVWGSSISLVSALHLAISTDVDWLEVPMVQLEVMSDEFSKIKERINNKEYIFNSGLGLEISDNIKNKYPFVNNSGYKIKGE